MHSIDNLTPSQPLDTQIFNPMYNLSCSIEDTQLSISHPSEKYTYLLSTIHSIAHAKYHTIVLVETIRTYCFDPRISIYCATYNFPHQTRISPETPFPKTTPSQTRNSPEHSDYRVSRPPFVKGNAYLQWFSLSDNLKTLKK